MVVTHRASTVSISLLCGSGSPSVAASLLRGHDEEALGILRVSNVGDLEAVVNGLLHSDYDRVVIDCGAEVHPLAVAAQLADTEAERPLKVTRLIAALPAEELLALTSANAPQTENAIATAEMVECADAVALIANSSGQFDAARRIAAALNHRATVYHFDELTREQLFDNSTSFDFDLSANGAACRQLADGDGAAAAEKDGVWSFVFKATRPFHPQRLLEALQPQMPSVFRAKGFLWVATRMDLVVGLNIAGRVRQLMPAGEWFAAQPGGSAATAPPQIRRHWREPFGDRRQAIAFFATSDVASDITARLESSLLTDEEMNQGEAKWASYSDPLPAWHQHDQCDNCDHTSHECCEHDEQHHHHHHHEEHHHCGCHCH